MLPTPSTSRPEVVGTITPPTVVEDATGRSLAVSATAFVINPSTSKVIPLTVAAVTEFAMLISPDALIERPESAGTETAPIDVAVASGRSDATRAVVSVM